MKIGKKWISSEIWNIVADTMDNQLCLSFHTAYADEIEALNFCQFRLF